MLTTQRRRLALVVARCSLALAVFVAALGFVPGASRLSSVVVLQLAVVVACPGVAVMWYARRGSDAAVLWSLRVLIAVGVITVDVGVLIGPFTSTANGIGFMGFVLVFSAMTLPLREHVAVLGVASGLLATIVVAGPMELIWIVVPSIGVGLLAAGGMVSHIGALTALEQQREASATTSAALRAVVAAAGAATSADVDDVLEAVTAATASIGSDTAGLYLIGPDRKMRYGAVHAIPHDMRDRAFDIDEGLAGQVVLSGRTLIENDYQTYDHAMDDYQDVHRLRSAIGAPILVDGELVGALVAGRFRSDPYDEASISAFELLAAHAGRAMTLAQAIGADRATLAHLRKLHHLQEDFVSTVSHELRTPLTVIDGAAETLVQLGDRLGPAMRQTLLERIASNAKGLSAVVTSILEMQRLDRGLAELETDPVEVAGLATERVRRLAPVLVEHIVTLDTEPAVAIGDSSLLERVIDNLLVNAARHTPPGTTVTVRVRTDADRVVLTVADDGPGIPAHEIGHITERFRRVGAPTTRTSRGLGIGLALVDQVVRLHGSRLIIESVVGEGTTFAFALNTAASRPEPERSSVGP